MSQPAAPLLLVNCNSPHCSPEAPARGAAGRAPHHSCSHLGATPCHTLVLGNTYIRLGTGYLNTDLVQGKEGCVTRALHLTASWEL
ncbi:hypothetical protein XENTR_v10012706 [Xenopus tropicalis]|nr:hypothetical protein XENTR_v10012706 [Xenopus tropicalis]